MQSSASATVFGVASLERTLPAVGLALVLLFVAVRPEASAGLGLPGRLGFWILHVCIGLAGLMAASLLIRRRLFTRWPLSLAIVVTGVIGTLAAAPAYWLLDQWWPVPGGAVPDDWLDGFAAAGPWQGVVAECLEVAPPFVTSWFAVNLPLILGQPRIDAPPPPSPPDPPRGRAPRQSAPSGAKSESAAGQFLDRLPAAIGRDVVAVSSDLHYLHVHTTLGSAMILGSLREAAAALGDAGMTVHRSHWVAHAHVRRVVIAGNEASCQLATGLRVPVSRRKRREVRRQYGDGALDLAGDRRQDAV
jgi:hypothetical protein